MEFATLQRCCKKTSAEEEIQKSYARKKKSLFRYKFSENTKPRKSLTKSVANQSGENFQTSNASINLACAANAVPKNPNKIINPIPILCDPCAT